MKYTTVKSIVSCLFTAILFSCSKDSGGSSNQISCDMMYSEAGGLQADGQVIYAAGVTGTHQTKIGTLTYQDSAGVTSVNNPTLPWTKTVNLKKGTGVTIKALAIANAGDTIVISAFADGSAGATTCP